MGIKETFLAPNIVLLGDVIPGEPIFVLPGPEATNQDVPELYWLSHLLDQHVPHVVCVLSRSVVSDSWQPHKLWPPRL